MGEGEWMRRTLSGLRGGRRLLLGRWNFAGSISDRVRHHPIVLILHWDLLEMRHFGTTPFLPNSTITP